MRWIVEDGLNARPFCMMDVGSSPGQTLVNEPSDAFAVKTPSEDEAGHDSLPGTSRPGIGTGVAPAGPSASFPAPST